MPNFIEKGQNALQGFRDKNPMLSALFTALGSGAQVAAGAAPAAVIAPVIQEDDDDEQKKPDQPQPTAEAASPEQTVQTPEPVVQPVTPPDPIQNVVDEEELAKKMLGELTGNVEPSALKGPVSSVPATLDINRLKALRRVAESDPDSIFNILGKQI